MKYYIKERHNPQLPTRYPLPATRYYACGKLSAAEARRKEQPAYGKNYLTGYNKLDYISKCKELNIDPVF